MRRRRRRILAGAGALLAASLVRPARAERRKHRIGFVAFTSPGPATGAFWPALESAGYRDGDNAVVVARFAMGRHDRLPGLVAEVLAQDVDVLVAVSTVTAVAAMKASARTPIVFASVMDPVAAGIVENLARPGGIVTGSAIGVGAGFGGKWVELLKEIVPQVARAAVLWSSLNQSSAMAVQEIGAAARVAGVGLDTFDAGNAARLEKALAALAESDVQGLIVAPDPYFNANRVMLVRFAAHRRLPAVYFFQSFAEAGGLIAYGANNVESIRTAARYVDRILRGARPADLPVEQPTRFHLSVNMKTARALGLAIPQSILLRADRVIE